MYLRRWQSGQLQQTVNLSGSPYEGSNPSRRTRVRQNSNLFGDCCFVLESKLLCFRTCVRVGDIFLLLARVKIVETGEEVLMSGAN